MPRHRFLNEREYCCLSVGKALKLIAKPSTKEEKERLCRKGKKVW